MKKKQIAGVAVSAAIVIVLGVCVWRMPVSSGTVPAASSPRGAGRVAVPGRPAPASLAKDEPPARPASRGEGAVDPVMGEATAEVSAVQTEQEKLVAATELLVEEFDSLVDAWRGQSEGEKKAKPVTMADVDRFAASFRKLPRDRRDECVHRALNLIPDENVMLLAGILMDKSMDREIVETVYNDILNRDEDVKKPILQQIFKDKSHPCWADTAWILDVTGELPKAK